MITHYHYYCTAVIVIMISIITIIRGPQSTVRTVVLRTSTMIGSYRHFFAIIATPTVLWGPLRGPRSTVRMVRLRTSAIIGYYRHVFAIIATPTVLWRPLSGGAGHSQTHPQIRNRVGGGGGGIV